jgi:hypothetical protein
MPTYFVDFKNGNDNFSGSSFDVIASGNNGRISTPPTTAYSTFSSVGASFPDDGTIASTKNEAWYTNAFYLNTTTSNSSINMTSISPPSGIDSTVFSLLENTSSSTHYLQSTTWFTPIYETTQYTLSIYAKAAGKNKVILHYGSDAKAARYNLSNGTVEETGVSVSSSSISDEGNGWYRLSLTITTGGSNSANYSEDNWQIYLLEDSFNSLTTSSSSYLGNDRDGILLCGMQIENASSATTYEKPPLHTLSIFNGSSYVSYYITKRISSTSLRINLISGGTALAIQTVNRIYYIGGRLKTITSTGLNAAKTIPGDTIRIMESPTPTIVGSGTWSTFDVNSPLATSNVVSATNASPIVVTCASTMSTLRINDGDTVLITGNTANTNSNGTWEVTSVSDSSCTLVGSSGNFNQTTSNGILRKMTNRIVKLDSPVTANIASFGNRGNRRTPWTASTSVTANFDTTTNVDSKEGDVSDRIAISAAFTTGKAAYKSTETLDLSSYQQLSLYIKQTAGTVAGSGEISLRLCSDTIGNTTVHTFNIPGIVANNFWIPFTIDLGSAMSSDIKSISFDINFDRGAQTFLLSNIIACKAPSEPDSLSLQSLISKNTSDECWYPIMSINGARIMLGLGGAANTNPATTTNRGGYYGITETVTTYKRETIKTDMVNSSATQVQTIPEGGIDGAPISYEFGWDTTSMTTRNSQTYYDGLNGLGYGLFGTSISYINLSNIGLVRYDHGLFFSNVNIGNHGLIECISNTAFNMRLTQVSSHTFDVLKSSAGGSNGIFSDLGFSGNTINKLISVGHVGNGLQMDRAASSNKINNVLCAINSFGIILHTGSDNIWTSGNSIYNNTDGVRHYGGYNDKFFNYSTSDNAGVGFNLWGGEVFCTNCLVNETVEFGNWNFSNSRIYAINHDNTSGNYLISTDGGLIRPQTSIRYSNDGYAWSLASTSATLRNANYPLDLKIATIAVSANAQVIIKAWVRRTSIALTMGLRMKGNQIAGVPNDITSYMTAPAETWQQISLNFTPTESGVVDIFVECWGGSTFTGYIDDLTIIQS